MKQTYKTRTVRVNVSGDNQKKTNSFLMDGIRSVKELLCPQTITVSEDCVKVDDNYGRNYGIKGYPSRVATNWLDDMYSYEGDMDVATHIEPADDRMALEDLTAKITQYEAQLMIEMQKGSIRNLSSLQSKIKTLYDQRARLEQNLENMFHVSTFCELYHHDHNALNKEGQKFQTKLSGNRTQITANDFRQDKGYQSVGPFGVCQITDYQRNMNTGALSSMFPFYNPEFNQPNGIFVGINRLRNTPVFVDLFDKKTLGNANLFISGASGSGKTFLVSLITLRSALQGIKTVILDPEGEYGRCVEVLNGFSVTLSPSANAGTNNACLNPFDVDEEYEVDDEGLPTGKKFVDIKGKVMELLNLFGVMFPNMMDAEVKAEVSETLMQLYQSFGFSEDINSLYEEKSFLSEDGVYYHDKVLKCMPRMSDLKKLLEQKLASNHNEKMFSFLKAFSMYCDGGVFDLFDCYTNINMADFEKISVLRFDIKGIEDAVLRPIGMTVATNWLWNKFIKKDLSTKKRIVCDEAWMMLSKAMAGSDYTAHFLENCARRIRKYNGSLCCASQNFREFVGRPEGQAILSNSAVRMFLRQTPEDIQSVGDRFILSDGEKEFLLSAGIGDVLMKVGNESLIVDVYAFAFETQLISKGYLE